MEKENFDKAIDIYEEESNLYDFELSQTFNFFRRNKLIIISITFIATLIGAVYSLSIKKSWEGQFKIVLDLQNDSKSSPTLPDFGGFSRSLANLSGLNKNLNTEIEILKSPSTLMPIFKYVIEEKSKLGEKTNKLKINNWIDKNLKIKLKKNTSVLNVIYQDNNKALIENVLNKISNKYQKYSSIKKQNNLNNNEVFLKNEISKYKKISTNSYKAAEKHALKYDLSKVNLLQSSSESIPSLSSINMINKPNNLVVENFSKTNETLLSISDQLKNINGIINYVEGIDNQSPQLENIINLGPNNELYEQIEYIDLKLSKYKSILRDDDDDIKDLERAKRILLISFKGKFLSYLEGEKARLSSLKDSIKRPTEVLLKYKELKEEVKRDQRTLNALEEELRFVLLEKARSPKPWALITNATLLDYPVAPNKKRITFLFFLLGTTLGTIFALIIEKREDLAFENKRIESIFNTKLIYEINTEEKEKNKKFLNTLSNSFNLINNKETKIISIKNIDKQYLNSIMLIFNDLKNKTETIINDKLIYDQKINSVIILLQSGSVEYSYLEEIKNILDIKKVTILGLLILKK